MSEKHKSISEYNAELRTKNITLKEYIKDFKNNSPTFVKIDGKLIHFAKVEELYLDKIVDGLELIPMGGVIYFVNFKSKFR